MLLNWLAVKFGIADDSHPASQALRSPTSHQRQRSCRARSRVWPKRERGKREPGDRIETHPLRSPVARLNCREKNGYLRLATEISFNDGRSEEGLVYIATEENSAFLGAASERAIAQQIAASHGPSGRNRDYLVDLAHALRQLGMDDPHVSRSSGICPRSRARKGRGTP